MLFLLFVVSGLWLVFAALWLHRRGRSLTSQTAFGGQLPYKGSLGRPAVIFDRSLFKMMVSFYELRTTSNDFFHGDIHKQGHEAWFYELRPAACGLRMAFSPNSISRDSHNGTPSHSCPFWQPSCASCWSAPDGPKRLTGRPLRKRSGGPPRFGRRGGKIVASGSWLVGLPLLTANC